ncbi:hypothetical protein Tco_0915314 [Tanacetum coccineum]
MKKAGKSMDSQWVPSKLSQNEAQLWLPAIKGKQHKALARPHHCWFEVMSDIFDLTILTDSLGYTTFSKPNQPAGTQDTNIHAGTQDSDSECDEQVIVVPSFPSNSFLGPKIHEASEMVESSLDYAEELARLQKQAYEANATAEKHLSQADLAASRNRVPAGKIDSAAGVSDGPTETSTPVFKPVHTDATSLPPGHSLGSSEHSTRYPSPSDLANSMSSSSEMEDIHHHPDTGIFSSSSYDDTLWRYKSPNLAPRVVKALLCLHQAPGPEIDMGDCETATTHPFEASKPKSKDEPDDAVNVHLYRSMIGSLMYLTASRPDIQFAVSACSRHQVTPLTSNLNAVKRFFKYHKGQPKLGLWYPRDSPFVLEAYSDSDYAGSHGDRKSTTGGCQFLGRRLISWQCKKQTIVATSSTKAEYVAAANCCGQMN